MRTLLALSAILALPAFAQSADPLSLPLELKSIQHFYAIMKRCEIVAPDRTAMRAREASFDRLLDLAIPAAGGWRTYLDADGRPQETHFNSAREMVYSVEFASDVKRYHQMVSVVPPSVLVNDCREYDTLVNQALTGK
jgi:hypothetical protein